MMQSNIFNRLVVTHECDERTDGQIRSQSQHMPRFTVLHGE